MTKIVIMLAHKQHPTNPIITVKKSVCSQGCQLPSPFPFLCLSGASFSMPLPHAFTGNPWAILVTFLFTSTRGQTRAFWKAKSLQSVAMLMRQAL
ncbi:hypothetical protein OIU79_006418 [Salix purpurea]|uniref:Uncharacterized protein n=1 Tax=Salix purpurea TaxID=77065 RepID=A0A9Q0Z235_SALPP|nr:hypothetical protein OIU79_006418 [Salix purpurea]